MKKIIMTLILCMLVLTLASCVGTKTLHCDGCNTEVKVSEKSNMEEDWIIYCDKCNIELFGDDPILGSK